MLAAHLIKNMIKTIIPDRVLLHRLPHRLSNSILFTFDDGPDRQLTPQVLDRLSKYNVRAVFFVVGKKIEESPDIFDMIVSQGHIIGNHTYNHPNRVISSPEQYRQELVHCQDVIKHRTGQIPKLVRPPLGISFATLQAAISLKKRTLLWSIEGGEWGIHKNENAGNISTRLVSALKPRDILLLHDDNSKVIQILETILPSLNRRKIDLTSGANYLSS